MFNCLVKVRLFDKSTPVSVEYSAKTKTKSKTPYQNSKNQIEKLMNTIDKLHMWLSHRSQKKQQQQPLSKDSKSNETIKRKKKSIKKK